MVVHVEDAFWTTWAMVGPLWFEIMADYTVLSDRCCIYFIRQPIVEGGHARAGANSRVVAPQSHKQQKAKNNEYGQPEWRFGDEYELVDEQERKPNHRQVSTYKTRVGPGFLQKSMRVGVNMRLRGWLWLKWGYCSWIWSLGGEPTSRGLRRLSMRMILLDCHRRVLVIIVDHFIVVHKIYQNNIIISSALIRMF